MGLPIFSWLKMTIFGFRFQVSLPKPHGIPWPLATVLRLKVLRHFLHLWVFAQRVLIAGPDTTQWCLAGYSTVRGAAVHDWSTPSETPTGMRWHEVTQGLSNPNLQPRKGRFVVYPPSTTQSSVSIKSEMTLRNWFRCLASIRLRWIWHLV